MDNHIDRTDKGKGSKERSNRPKNKKSKKVTKSKTKEKFLLE